jgi:hypothetical protein
MCSPSAFLRGLVSLLRVGDRRRLRTRPVPTAASRHHLAGDDKSGIAGRRSPSLWRRRPRPPFRPAGPVRTSGAVGCAPATGSRNGTGRRSPWLLELPSPWSLEGLVRPATGIAPARGWLRLRRSDSSGAATASLSVRAGRPTIPSLSMTARLNRRLSLSGQVRSLARDFRGSATLSSAPLALQVDVVTHPVLGSSPGGWVGRPCR